MKQILDNGALVTLGLVAAVAAVGAANKAGLYGSTGSAARGFSFGWAKVEDGRVTRLSHADRKPSGSQWGEINTVNTKIGDRAYLDGGMVYLEGGSSNEGSAARGVTEGYVESYLDGDNIAISTFLGRHLRGKAKQFAGQYARRLKAALDAMVVSGEVYRDTTPNRAPSYRRTSSDSGTAGSAARALRGSPHHVGPSVKRMVDFLEISKGDAAAIKARMNDGVPYKAILEMYDYLKNKRESGVYYTPGNSDGTSVHSPREGLSYVKIVRSADPKDINSHTLIYDHKSNRFFVDMVDHFVEDHPARFLRGGAPWARR